MRNVLALSLILTTLVTASVFSPSPQKHNPREDDVILKEGHRVVVVEYEKDDKNTKVSISPQDIDGQPTNLKDKLSGKVEDAKEQINEEEIQHRFSPRELVCDAYGKCKHKIASAIGKTKDTLSDKAQEATEKAAETAHVARDRAAEKVHEAAGKAAETAHLARDKAAETAHLARDKAEEKVREGADKAAEKVHGAADRVYEVEEEAKEAIGNLKERVTHKSREAKEYVTDSVYEKASEVRGATEKAKGGAETAKNLQGEIERNGSRIVDVTKEKIPDSAKKAGEIVESASEKVKDSAQRVKNEGERGLKRFLHRGRGILANISERTEPLMGVLHLLGLASAYGMCMWVSFVSSFVLAGALPRQQFGMVQSKIYPVYFKAMTYSVGLALLGHVLSRSRRLSSSSMKREMIQGFNLGAPLLMILVNSLYLEPRSSKVMLERMKKEKEEGRFTTEPSSRVVDAFTGRASPSTGKEGFVMEQLDRVSDRAATGTHGETTTTSSSQKAAQDRTEEEAVKAQLLRLSGILKRLNQYSSLLNVLTLMSLTWHLGNLGLHLNSVC